jgi:hypothetical protein
MMKSVINPNIFRHTAVASEGFNNLCTIVHPLGKEGQYNGQVFIKKQYVGSFQLTIQEKSESTQADIDVSSFDPLYLRKDHGSPGNHFEMSKGGYVVIYASGHHDGAYVTISRSGEKADSKEFDTRKLGKDDLVVFRPFHPGKYKLLNKLDGKQASFSIEEKKERGYTNPAKLEPVTVPLTLKGFELPGNGTLHPFQAMVIKPDIACSLVMEMEKPKEHKKKAKAKAKIPGKRKSSR